MGGSPYLLSELVIRTGQMEKYLPVRDESTIIQIILIRRSSIYNLHHAKSKFIIIDIFGATIAIEKKSAISDLGRNSVKNARIDTKAQ